MGLELGADPGESCKALWDTTGSDGVELEAAAGGAVMVRESPRPSSSAAREYLYSSERSVSYRKFCIVPTFSLSASLPLSPSLFHLRIQCSDFSEIAIESYVEGHPYAVSELRQEVKLNLPRGNCVKRERHYFMR